MDCIRCPIKYQTEADVNNRPVSQDFYKYLEFYLHDNPGLKCSKGGHAAYGEAVEIDPQNALSIGATMFTSYHTRSITSLDFIESLKQSIQISNNVTNMMRQSVRKWTDDQNLIDNIQVFPYSIFHVFYEQYLDIWRNVSLNIGVSLLAIFIVTVILMGLDVYTGLIVTGTIIMIIINMFAAMYLLKVELNAISIVNLVIAVGISVEFCAHIAREFAISNQETRIDRAKY